MMTHNPTLDVSCKYGAPMGRQSDNLSALIIEATDAPFTLQRIDLIDNGCYDAGGAYWGHGEPLYHWHIEYGDETASGFFGAANRDAAEREITSMHELARFEWHESALHVSSYLALTQLPEACIAACSASGDVGAAVSMWCRELRFTVDRTRAIELCDCTGAWTRFELNHTSNETLAERILWMACCTFDEFITHCEDSDIDPRGEIPEDFEPSSGSDIFVLE